MINLYFIAAICLILLIIFLISNYTALTYGVRLGKAMRKDVPPAPTVEPIKKAAKKVNEGTKNLKIKLLKHLSDVKNGKFRKKVDVEEEEMGMFD